MKNIFVIILRYLVPLEVMNDYRGVHLEFLDKHYKAGLFIASGRQEPQTGGVILAKAASRKALIEVLKDDPFQVHELAEYQIFEFAPNKYSKEFERILA